MFILFFVGLMPFNFLQKNEAKLSEVSGLHITAPSIAYTEVPPEKLSALKQFTVLMNLSSYLSEWTGYMKILTYSKDANKMNFMISQWDDSLVFRLNADGKPKTIHFESEGFFKKNKTVALAIVYDGKALSSYRNGLKIKELQTGPLTFNNWNKEYPLIIGAEATGKYCWDGYIYSVSIFDRALSHDEIQKQVIDFNKKPPLIKYSFKENKNGTVYDLGSGRPANLSIPHYFRPYKRDIIDFDLTWLYEYRRYYMDIWIDIIGFMPLGFLLAAYFTKKRTSYLLIMLKSLLIGAGISFTIELLQSFLPSRSSSLTDILTNSLGALIGAVVFKEVRVLRKNRFLKFDSIENDKKELATKKDSMHVITSIDNRHILQLFAMMVTLWMFYNPLRALLSTYDETESYLYIVLIPLISGYLIYEKWDKLIPKFSYSLKTGGILICIGLVLFFFGKTKMFVLNKNDYASLITFSAGIFWIGSFILLYGVKTFRAILFPLLFLLVMIPIPTLLLKKTVALLQQGSANITYIILKLVHIPFAREGFVFYLPHNISVEISEPCSGIHSMLALLIISVLASHLFLKKNWKKVVLVLFVFPIAFIKNGIRITVLSLLGTYIDERFLTQGFLHKSGGLVFYVPALAIVLCILWLLKKSENKLQ
jgi:exosortase